MALTIQDKIQFVSMSGNLSPENLCCDGEISAAAAERRRKAIMREWRALEAKVGQKVTEDEAWRFLDEVKAHERQQRATEIAAQPSHPLVESKNIGVWSRKGQNGQTAYYIWGPTKTGAGFTLFSEFAYRVVGKREEIGQFTSLNAAVEAAEAFLGTITYDLAKQTNPLWRPENLKRELQRLPEGFDPKIPAMPPVTGFTLRFGHGDTEEILENVQADEIAAILVTRLVERDQFCAITSA